MTVHYDPQYRPLYRPGLSNGTKASKASRLWHDILADDSFETEALAAIQDEQDRTAELCSTNFHRFALENL